MHGMTKRKLRGDVATYVGSFPRPKKPRLPEHFQTECLVPERNVPPAHTNNQSAAKRKMKMAAAALCLAVFASVAVGHLAHPEETLALNGQEGASSALRSARKLLQGSPMMMGMSMSPMMMPMAPSMMPAPMMYMLSLTPSAEVPAVSYHLPAARELLEAVALLLNGCNTRFSECQRPASLACSGMIELAIDPCKVNVPCKACQAPDFNVFPTSW